MTRLMTIGETAKKLGLSTNALRKWEQRPEVAPASIRIGNERFYEESEVARLCDWYAREREARLASRNGSNVEGDSESA